MSDTVKKTPGSHSARQYTAHLKEILQGRASEAKPQAAETASKAVSSTDRTAVHSHYPKHEGPTDNRFLRETNKLPRKPNPLQKADHYTEKKGRSRLARLIKQTHRLAELNKIFHVFLPPHLQEHAILARLDTDSWIVQTDSPAWATRLRYVLPGLRQPLSEHLEMPIPAPTIRIAPPTIPPPPAAAPRRMAMSDATAKTLEKAAGDFSDPRLGAALQRLVKHAKCHNQGS